MQLTFEKNCQPCICSRFMCMCARAKCKTVMVISALTAYRLFQNFSLTSRQAREGHMCSRNSRKVKNSPKVSSLLNLPYAMTYWVDFLRNSTSTEHYGSRSVVTYVCVCDCEIISRTGTLQTLHITGTHYTVAAVQALYVCVWLRNHLAHSHTANSAMHCNTLRCSGRASALCVCLLREGDMLSRTVICNTLQHSLTLCNSPLHPALW